MLAISGLRLLMREIDQVKLSAAAHAVLSTTCEVCRVDQQRPWCVSSGKVSGLSACFSSLPNVSACREEGTAAANLSVELQQAAMPDANVSKRKTYNRIRKEVTSASR